MARPPDSTSTNISRVKGPSCCVRCYGVCEADRSTTYQPDLPHLEDGAAKGVFRWPGQTDHPRDEAHALTLAASSLTGLTAWPPTFVLVAVACFRVAMTMASFCGAAPVPGLRTSAALTRLSVKLQSALRWALSSQPRVTGLGLPSASVVLGLVPQQYVISPNTACALCTCEESIARKSTAGHGIGTLRLHMIVHVLLGIHARRSWFRP